jgi:group I intron endonuclease
MNYNHNEFMNLETFYINLIDPKFLFNFKLHVTSMKGYKHYEISREKTIKRMKENHPMKGKFHSKLKISLALSKDKNHRFNIPMSEETKLKLSKLNSKGDIQVYDKNNKLLYTFTNAIEASKNINISKSTI